MKATFVLTVLSLALSALASASPTVAGSGLATGSLASSTAVVAVADEDNIIITRDKDEVKGMKKLGEIEGRSPFFGLSGKLGDKGAAKKLKEAAAKLGATKVLIVSEDRMGATTLRGIAYK